MKKLQKGFTLIELLVVIAIIGILASIVLASLSTARGKGNDAKIEGQLSGLRDAAEIYYSTAGNYGTAAAVTTCVSTGAVNSAFSTSFFNDSTSGGKGIVLATASTIGASTFNCAVGQSGATWAAIASLNTSGSYWCVDSSGASKSETSATLSTTGGSTATATCQ